MRSAEIGMTLLSQPQVGLPLLVFPGPNGDAQEQPGVDVP